MAHDVFISYSTKDKTVGDALCAALEGDRIRCWMAPRDILPGAPWAESIIDAINGSRVMVLIYSEHSNKSPQVQREVERAVAKAVAILPFRIEDVPLSKGMEYCISTHHWLDALTPPLEKHLQHLGQTVRMLLERLGAPVLPAPVLPAPVAAPPAAPAPTKTATNPACPALAPPPTPAASVPSRPAAPSAATPAKAPIKKEAIDQQQVLPSAPTNVEDPEPVQGPTTTPNRHAQNRIQKYVQSGAWEKLRGILEEVAQESGARLRTGIEVGIREVFATLDDAGATAASDHIEQFIASGKAWPNLSWALGSAWADRAEVMFKAALERNAQGVRQLELEIKLITENPQRASAQIAVTRVKLQSGFNAIADALSHVKGARQVLDRARRHAGESAFAEQAAQFDAAIKAIEGNLSGLQPLAVQLGIKGAPPKRASGAGSGHESMFAKLGRWWRGS